MRSFRYRYRPGEAELSNFERLADVGRARVREARPEA